MASQGCNLDRENIVGSGWIELAQPDNMGRYPGDCSNGCGRSSAGLCEKGLGVTCRWFMTVVFLRLCCWRQGSRGYEVLRFSNKSNTAGNVVSVSGTAANMPIIIAQPRNSRE